MTSEKKDYCEHGTMWGIEYESQLYNEERRDWESMLKNVVDKDAQEFLPLIEYDNINNKVLKRPFPIIIKMVS